MKTFLKLFLFSCLGIFMLVIGIVVIGVIADSGNKTAAVTPTTASAAQVPQPDAPAPQPADPAPQPVADAPAAIPASEQNLVNIVANATSQYDQAANDMAKGAVRAQRKAAICQAFPGSHVSNWVGTIQTLDSTGSGKGVLAVQINPNLTVATDNNDLSDSMGDDSTIPAGSPLFQTVSQMKTGDTVIFSGDFIRGDDDCFEEQSLTTDGSMDAPAFTFRFSAVREAN